MSRRRTRRRRRNEEKAEIRIVPDDVDPELVRGAIVIPVTRSAKEWLRMVRKFVKLEPVSFVGRKREAYWIPMEDVILFGKFVNQSGWRVSFGAPLG